MTKDIAALDYALRTIVEKDYPNRNPDDLGDLRNDLHLLQKLAWSLETEHPAQFAIEAVEHLGLF
ncbi:hypothetical protein IMZ48_32480 [Candidatus Bathyarchaeota archaeon]|nr:hypothetical protein [Candidatus Bathyarchaeota archaeon]